jgi:hypothetical protein
MTDLEWINFAIALALALGPLIGAERERSKGEGPTGRAPRAYALSRSSPFLTLSPCKWVPSFYSRQSRWPSRHLRAYHIIVVPAPSVSVKRQSNVGRQYGDVVPRGQRHLNVDKSETVL